MFAFVLFATILLIWVLSKLMAYRRYTAKLDIVPQFKGLPLIGIAHKLIDVNKAVQIGLDLFKQCGRSHTLYIGPIPYLIVCDPELAEVILSSNVLIDKNYEYKFTSAWFGDGLLTSTGEKWKSHRKILTPSFHYSILEEFVQTFDKASKVLVQKLEKEVENKNPSVDIYKYLTLCTLDIICETAMGTVINAQDNPNLAFVHSIQEMCHLIFLRVMSPLRVNWIYRLTKFYQREVNALKELRNFSDTIIAKRKAVLEQKGTFDAVDEFGTKRKHSFLDVLLQATVNGRKLTDEEIRNEVDTFMFEGHDTTGVALSFVIYLLSKHQDVQKKVYDEIIHIIGPDKTKSVTIDELNQLKYTEMVIKESLRIYPSVMCFGRSLSKDVPYNNGFIPKGVPIVFNAYNMHRNPNTFPDPEKFDPERFSLENSAGRHPYGYIPFSAGPRNCIGQKFAMLELKSTISKILRFYEVLPAIPHHEVNVITMLTLQSSNGIRLRLEHREKSP